MTPWCKHLQPSWINFEKMCQAKKNHPKCQERRTFKKGFLNLQPDIKQALERPKAFTSLATNNFFSISLDLSIKLHLYMAIKFTSHFLPIKNVLNEKKQKTLAGLPNLQLRLWHMLVTQKKEIHTHTHTHTHTHKTTSDEALLQV